MKSLHFKLFSRYAALIISIIMIFMILLYFVWGNTLRSNASSELQADCDNISTLLDTKISQINQLSVRIVSSKQLQNLLVRDLYSNELDAYNNRSSFSDALFEIIKLSFDNMALNILDTSDHYIHVGMTSTYQCLPSGAVSEIPWFRPVLDAYGKRVILPPRIPELDSSETPVLSFCRAFAPKNRKNETAVLELQLSYPFFSRNIQDAIHNQKDIKKVVVVNKDGQLIYPYEASIPDETMSYIREILKNPERSDTPKVSRVLLNDPALFSYQYSPSTEWTVFVAAYEKEMFFSFYMFRTLIIIAFFLILILTVSITYRIAARLTAPLKTLEQTANSLTFDNLTALHLPDYKSNFKELDSLYHSFSQMQHNLQNSLQEVVSAHTMAVDAKMLALQSQMNPHFLYNTLASIVVLAEDGEDDKIIKMCEDLSLLLRYIASGTSMETELRQEIEHTLSYIHLIKIKYEERIRFHLTIEESLLSLRVPKLIVQPLVENCIKYALNTNPPWEIFIDGFAKDGQWFVQIKDNGPGFSEEFLEQFWIQAAQIDPGKPLPGLSINGMGLLNLYTRLSLRYKNEMIFELKNMLDGGACITIGGPL